MVCKKLQAPEVNEKYFRNKGIFMRKDVLLEVSNLKTYFFTKRKINKAVDGLSFSIKKGKVMGLVGISGSGKSVVAMSILNLISKPGRIVSGEVIFKDRDLLKLRESDLQKILGSDITFVAQDPFAFLDPLYSIGDQIIETIQAHEKVSKKMAREKTIELLATVGIPDQEDRMLNFPYQFSGGMQQRIIIATAIACNPSLIIMDDPTRSLDVTIQAQILAVLEKLKIRYKTTLLLISASIEVVAQVADDIIIILGGQCMEMGSKQSILEIPCHPYTKKLLKGVPSLKGERLRRLGGLDILHKKDIIGGCVFSPYCNKVQRKCLEAPPPLVQVGEDHYSACHFVKSP